MAKATDFEIGSDEETQPYAFEGRRDLRADEGVAGAHAGDAGRVPAVPVHRPGRRVHGR